MVKKRKLYKICFSYRAKKKLNQPTYCEFSHGSSKEQIVKELRKQFPKKDWVIKSVDIIKNKKAFFRDMFE